MKIIVDKDIPFIMGRFPEGVTVEYLRGDEIDIRSLRGAGALIVRTRTKCNEHLLKGSEVRLIATATIGKDHIDEEWCEKNGIVVRNAPGCNAPGVAQYLFSSLFQTGFDPKKDVLGIIGYGKVGRQVAEWAKTLGIKSLVSDILREEAGYRDTDYRGLEEVLRNSDAVTLHVPLTFSGDKVKYPTYRMIGEKELGMMKTGALLVNSSRGGVVDESALKASLLTGRVRGVVDVWEKEPDIDSELLSLVEIGTPHIAGYSYEGKKRATLMVLKALEEELGIKCDISGLECKTDREKELSANLITQSYDPSRDYEALKRNVKGFESLRNEYKYRHEPFFI